MCGFVAVHHFDGTPVDAELLRRMRDAMLHRGPDDAGLLVDGATGLAHRRLSIVDLSPSGRQPMCNEDGSVWILFNGEVYDYPELAAGLERRGHCFRSRTDTETILHLYEELGERCVERLNGMFAFVIWDARDGSLFCARDRLGIKPFVYYVDARRCILASEAKAILADPSVPRAPDLRALGDVLHSGFPLGGRTMFEGIRELRPGECLTVRGGRVATRAYWDVAFRYRRDRSDADTRAELAALLQDAVRLQCRSDAPLGCHLSGGLDSSTVAALAARVRPGLPSFSIRFGDGGYYDETRFARAVSRHAGTTYHEDAPGRGDFFSLLPRLVWHVEMPLPNYGAYAYATGSRLAARHVKVSLTGHGGDELFGGYPAQFLVAFGSADAFATVGAPRQGPSLARRVAARLARDGLRGAVAAALRRLRATRRAPTPAELWAALHCGPPPAAHPLLHPRLAARLRDHDARGEYLRPFREAPADDLFGACLYHDLRVYLPGLLHLEDRASMAVSLESRIPLLDHRIVEYAATVPPELKVPGRRPKGLLREVARAWLPAEVAERRDKAPFPVPMREWLASPPPGLVARVLRSTPALDRGILHPDLLRAPLGPDLLWCALGVELWCRIFLDGETVERLEAAAAEELEAESPRRAGRGAARARVAVRG